MVVGETHHFRKPQIVHFRDAPSFPAGGLFPVVLGMEVKTSNFAGSFKTPSKITDQGNVKRLGTPKNSWYIFHHDVEQFLNLNNPENHFLVDFFFVSSCWYVVCVCVFLFVMVSSGFFHVFVSIGQVEIL